jgi:uncharacterized LabA/DUF88 family protein
MLTQKAFIKVGVYVDATYAYKNGGSKMQYGILRQFATRDGSEIIRLNAYVSFDAERGKKDLYFKETVGKYHAVLRDFGYKVIIKEVKWFRDDNGELYGKANADLDLAIDMLLQSEKLDKVVLVTGDGDFTQVVKAVQNRGVRVEVIAFDNVSSELRNEADTFLSGFLIPDLVPIASDPKAPQWGQIGSRVRGTCCSRKDDFGFMRFMERISPEICLSDAKNPDSPYKDVYFHESQLPKTINYPLPSYNHVFEFELARPPRKEDAYEAKNIQFVSRFP